MGYRGKIDEQNRARDLRALGWTYNEICAELGVSKSSVSLWCRDIEMDEAVWADRVDANKRRGLANRRPSSLSVRKQAEIQEMRYLATELLGSVTDRDLFLVGIALYAGEGSKGDGTVKFANSDPRMIAVFLRWLRHFFEIDEARLRLRLYLHQGLDLDAANAFWSAVTGIPIAQFTKPYRAEPDPSIRRAKHIFGCPSIGYSCSRTHRLIMGLVLAVLGPGGNLGSRLVEGETTVPSLQAIDPG
jgi:hypothetical protein